MNRLLSLLFYLTTFAPTKEDIMVKYGEQIKSKFSYEEDAISKFWSTDLSDSDKVKQHAALVFVLIGEKYVKEEIESSGNYNLLSILKSHLDGTPEARMKESTALLKETINTLNTADYQKFWPRIKAYLQKIETIILRDNSIFEKTQQVCLELSTLSVEATTDNTTADLKVEDIFKPIMNILKSADADTDALIVLGLRCIGSALSKESVSRARNRSNSVGTTVHTNAIEEHVLASQEQNNTYEVGSPKPTNPNRSAQAALSISPTNSTIKEGVILLNPPSFSIISYFTSSLLSFINSTSTEQVVYSYSLALVKHFANAYDQAVKQAVTDPNVDDDDYRAGYSPERMYSQLLEAQSAYDKALEDLNAYYAKQNKNLLERVDYVQTATGSPSRSRKDFERDNGSLRDEDVIGTSVSRARNRIDNKEY